MSFNRDEMEGKRQIRKGLQMKIQFCVRVVITTCHEQRNALCNVLTCLM